MGDPNFHPPPSSRTVTVHPHGSIPAMSSPGPVVKMHRFVMMLALFVMAGALASAAPPPSELTNEQFWKLATELSENDGKFRSDNLVSNESTFQYVIPEILQVAKQGRIYLGVGPEQNFTYIAALKPSMVFIIDIRHGNFDVHLMYKALFEMSKDRADFVSRLFSRKRPESLTAKSSVKEIFDAVETAEGNRELFAENLKSIEDHLMKKRGFPLSDGDRAGIEWALLNYYKFGPYINYGASLSSADPPEIVGVVSGGFGGRGNNGVTYQSLMVADDGRGEYRSYLANEENFNVLKNLHTRNLIVPVVGDFAGTKAIRGVGQYLKTVDGTVSAFYLSNVEQYLQGTLWLSFCRNVLSLPRDETSMFIRSGRGSPFTVTSTGNNVQSSSFALMSTELQCSPNVP